MQFDETTTNLQSAEPGRHAATRVCAEAVAFCSKYGTADEQHQRHEDAERALLPDPLVSNAEMHANSNAQ